MSGPKTPGQVAFEAYYSDIGSPEQLTAAWHKRRHHNEEWEAAAQAVLAHAAAQGNGWQQPPAWLAGIDQSDIAAVFEAAQRNLPPPPQKAQK